jgi:hypothetical protein
MIADRVFDLGEAGLGEEAGKRADHFGVGRERRLGKWAAPAELAP